MRRLILAAICALSLGWFVPPEASAQVSYVQRRTACSSGCDVTDTFASDGQVVVSGLSSCTVGNAIAVLITSDFSDTTYTASDNGSNTYSDGVDVVTATEFDFSLKYARCASGATSITITAGGGGTFGVDAVTVFEFSGMPNPLVVDGSNTGTSSGATTHTTPSISTTVANTVVLAGATCSNGSYTLEADFATNGRTGTHWWHGYHILSSTATDAATATSAASEACAMGILVLQGSGGGGASCAASMSLLGVSKCD